MKNPTYSEVVAAAQVLRRFNQYLNEQAVTQAKTLPPTDVGVRQGDGVESRVLAEMQTVDDIIAKLVAWAEQLKQRPFLQSPLPVISSAFLADAPASKTRRDVGFTMLGSNDTNELAPAYYTGSLDCPCVPSVRWNNRLHCRFWPEPVSIFGSLGMTVPMAVHLCWAFHPACPSDHIDARSRGDCLTEVSSSRRWRDVVSIASDPTVTNRASTDRLLRTEPQVRLTNLFSYRTITVTSSFSRQHALPLRVRRFSCCARLRTQRRACETACSICCFIARKANRKPQIRGGHIRPMLPIATPHAAYRTSPALRMTLHTYEGTHYPG
jgi:hypothetical protein